MTKCIAARPKVAVMVITYNHVRYLGQALDSILSQQVDFDLAIHVIDDCSTDGNQELILDYAARYPGVVIPFINKKNIGRKVTQKNFYRGFKTLDADYIAVLEGDDYWVGNDKLQSQIDFLDANPDFVACAHNVLKVYEDNSKPSHLFLPPPNRETFDIEDLIFLRAYFHTTTLTYRNVLRGRIPRQFRNRLSCDIFNTIAHAQYGKVHFDPRVMSVYRAHSGGVFSGMNDTEGWIFNINGLRQYNAWLGYRFWPAFAGAIYRYCDYMLERGKVEDGLTPWVRLKYRTLGAFYRQLAKLGQR